MRDLFDLSIDGLLDADASNVDTCKAILNELSPCILEASETIRGMYKTQNRICADAFRGAFDEGDDDPPTEGLNSIRDCIVRAEEDSIFRESVFRQFTAHAQISLIMRIGILFSQAFVDLLRLRVTAPLAYLRLQVESVALVVLMSERPGLAGEWIEATDEERGRKFFKKHQPAVIETLTRTKLLDFYNMASGSASHSRLIAVARAMTVHHLQQGDEHFSREYAFRAQEFAPENTLPFYITVLYVLRAQERIFRAIFNFVPGMEDGIFTGSRIPHLSALLDRISPVIEARRVASRVD